MHSRRPPSLRHKSKRSRRKQQQSANNGDGISVTSVSTGETSKPTTRSHYKRFSLLAFVLIVLGTLYRSLLNIVNNSTADKLQPGHLIRGGGDAGSSLSDPQQGRASFERKIGRPMMVSGEEQQGALDGKKKEGAMPDALEQRAGESETAKE